MIQVIVIPKAIPFIKGTINADVDANTDEVAYDDDKTVLIVGLDFRSTYKKGLTN